MCARSAEEIPIPLSSTLIRTSSFESADASQARTAIHLLEFEYFAALLTKFSMQVMAADRSTTIGGSLSLISFVTVNPASRRLDSDVDKLWLRIGATSPVSGA